MREIKEVIVVEGRYDKITVNKAVKGTVIETSGFGILNNKEKIALLKKLAEKRGLVLLTDSDKAGFFIRGRLKGLLGDDNIKHAYIPNIKGREKRKTSFSKEGTLGVEGMTKNAIIKSLELAGATFKDEATEQNLREAITKADLFSLGLSGGDGSAKKRRELLKQIALPERLSANGLIDVINILFTREEFLLMCESNHY